MAARKSTRVNRKYKTKYRVTNWQEYERGFRGTQRVVSEGPGAMSRRPLNLSCSPTIPPEFRLPVRRLVSGFSCGAAFLRPRAM